MAELQTTWACGVLEGGGAKGAAYAPALDALAEKGVRFCSVAGSSAGALTAAMIAAGCTPAEIRQYTLKALEILAPPRLKLLGTLRLAVKGLRLEPPRIRPIDKLLALLERVLREKCGVPPEREEPVTFEELHQHPGSIELFVVAVDAVGRKEYVFHHALSPDQGVANAAVASAAIPVYFPPGQPTGGEQPYSAILFDGGVWANFPTWIYKDRSFRQYHLDDGKNLPLVSGLQNGSLEHPLILGLLLDEERDPQTPPGTTEMPVASGQPQSGQGLKKFVSRQLGRTLLAAVLAFTSPIYLFALVYFLVAVGSTIGCMTSGGNYCEVRSEGIADTADWVFLGAIPLVIFQALFKQRKRTGAFIAKFYGAAEVVGSFFGLGLIAVAKTVALAEISPGDSSVQTPISFVEGGPLPPAMFGGFALWMGGAVTILALTFVAAFAPAVQGIGRKVMFVLTSAGSARYWVGAADDDHVIRIPVKGLQTLSFGEALGFVEDCSDDVQARVGEQVDEILAPLQSSG